MLGGVGNLPALLQPWPVSRKLLHVRLHQPMKPKWPWHSPLATGTPSGFQLPCDDTNCTMHKLKRNSLLQSLHVRNLTSTSLQEAMQLSSLTINHWKLHLRNPPTVSQSIKIFNTCDCASRTTAFKWNK